LTEENLITEEVNNKLLLATDNEGKAVLHMTARVGKLEILQEILDLAKEKLTAEVTNKILLATEN